MIEVDIRSKAFGRTEILKDVRFSLAPGETLAILGRSGIGKSTLLRLVAGIDTAFSGTVIRPNNQAFVFQEPTLLPWRTALDNLRLFHPALSRDNALDILTKVGLGGKDALYPGQLSLGQQRRLSLARAFAGRPQLLILDEPFASLDDKTAAKMVTLTRALMADVKPATLLVTHERDQAQQLAGRLIELGGTPATIVADTSVSSNIVRPVFQREEVK